jgi:hypothetical protein
LKFSNFPLKRRIEHSYGIGKVGYAHFFDNVAAVHFQQTEKYFLS